MAEKNFEIDRTALGTGEPIVASEPTVLYYTGDGMHSIPGLPMRDLTQADIDTSPYKADPDQILKFTPEVFATGTNPTHDAEGNPLPARATPAPFVVVPAAPTAPSKEE